MSVDASLISLSMNNGITWTTNWRNADHHLNANSFLIKVEDFKKILEEPGVEYVRLYLGLKISPDHDHPDQNKIEEKLICVGADKNQIDILKNINAEDASGIYDFSHPCPPLCEDDESPLAGGEE
jgi:hypothetical protein